MRITDAALGAGFIAVALSSQDRAGSRCWDTGWPPEQSNDIPKVSQTTCVRLAYSTTTIAIACEGHKLACATPMCSAHTQPAMVVEPAAMRQLHVPYHR